MITHLKVTNFKSIREADITFKPLTVLIGANGVGKSNILSFFELLQVSLYPLFPQKIALGGFADNILYFGLKKSKSIEVFVEFEGDLFHHFQLIPTKTGLFSFAFEKTNEFETHDVLHYSWLGSPELQNWNKEIKRTYQSLVIFHFNDTSTQSSLRQQARIDDIYSFKNDNLPAYLYHIQKMHSQRFQLIESHIRQIAPFFHSFDLRPRRDNPEFIELKWLHRADLEKYFNAQDLSDGTLRFIALATLLLQPQPPPVILLDEPELGLHPAAIAQLVPFFRQAIISGSQVIVATQSPQLLNDCELDEIVTVNYQNDETVFSHLNSNDLTHWLEDYSIAELWQKNVIPTFPTSR